MDRKHAERILLQRGWLADQRADFQAQVLASGRLLAPPVRSFLFHAGDDAGGIYGVVSGGIGVHMSCTDGETRLVHIVRAGGWLGYRPLVLGGSRILTFSVCEESYLLHLPLTKMREIAASSLAFQHAVLTITEYGMDAAMRAVETLLIRSAERRVAATLLRLADIDEQSFCGTVVLRLTQAELGEMANADRKVVNRAMRKLTARGWLQNAYGTIEIRDAHALASFAWGS